MKKILLIALLLSSLIGAGQISNQDSTARRFVISDNLRGMTMKNIIVPYYKPLNTGGVWAAAIIFTILVQGVGIIVEGRSRQRRSA